MLDVQNMGYNFGYILGTLGVAECKLDMKTGVADDKFDFEASIG